MTCFPMSTSDTLHWLNTEVVLKGFEQSDLTKASISKFPKIMVAKKTLDYDTWHCHFGHPSKDVL